MIVNPDDESEVIANRLIASTVASQETMNFLSNLSDEMRVALEGLLAEGLIAEHENGFVVTERGQEVLSKIEDWFDDK